MLGGESVLKPLTPIAKMNTEEQRQFNEHCAFEDTLINNRLTWLLASESLLFAGYGGIASIDKLDLDQIARLTIPFSAVGIALAILIFVSIVAAVAANIYNYHRLQERDPTISLGVYPCATVTAWVVTCLVPLAFVAGWMLLRWQLWQAVTVVPVAIAGAWILTIWRKKIKNVPPNHAP